MKTNTSGYIVIGLGNPGETYRNTPHNIGARLVEQLVDVFPDDYSDFVGDKYNQYDISQNIFTCAGEDNATDTVHDVQLRISWGYMNSSGEAVKNVAQPEKLIVVYDDIDLPFGAMRISYNRGSGGHNGIASIEKTLKTRTFIRLRVGVCPIDTDGLMRKPATHAGVSRYLVDKQLPSGQIGQYSGFVKTINSMLREIVCHGVEKAMAKYN